MIFRFYRHAMPPTPSDLEVLSDPAQIAALMDPVRRRLINALVDAPDSAVGLARRLGDSRQRLNYHLRQLEELGLVELAEVRPRRGLKERVLRPVARHFVVDSASLGDLAAGPSDGGDRLSATWLVALASRAVRELSDLMHRARGTRKRLPTAGMSVRVRLAEPAAFGAFIDELTRAVGEVVARYHTEDGDGRSFRVLTATYPAPPAVPPTHEGGGEDEPAST
jgi:DNA-binding transcriptional ArsR family regulator